ncbi:putative DNA-binding protein [Amphibacillus cookii]|uniref:putative DNA-binding protein n=1 Tax=Amphibacillus cookii TaxID=767787 RepID=UPI00195EC8EC|nr:putative DNA-binding protein [Amphibacillus cookii]MBM7540548.1 putative DNA-binding protein YlxM (UPF0122 family) [Amphibacillus cookii]
MLEKTTRVNFLLDFYQALLTPKQRNYMELYYLEDYSLGEISEAFNVSRQAVYDNIRRTESMLESYEDKLKLYKKFLERQALLNKLSDAVEPYDAKEINNYVEQLKELD